MGSILAGVDRPLTKLIYVSFLRMGILGACVSKKSQVSDLEIQGDLIPCLDYCCQ